MMEDSLWPEDTIECRLYATGGLELTKLAVDCTHYTRTLLPTYLWHYDVFSLQVCTDGKTDSWHTNILLHISAGSANPNPHLISRTCFRDNIEDEWAVVYLMFELSKRFSDLVIR